MRVTPVFLLSSTAPDQPTSSLASIGGTSGLPITFAKTKQKPTLIFADLPGYGYAKISRSISAEWPTFIEPYLAERATLALGVCLVDTNIPPQPSDTQLIEFFKQTQRPYLVVGTKSDRISNNVLQKSLAALRKAHGVEEVLPVSDRTEAGAKSLWSRLMMVAGS